MKRRFCFLTTFYPPFNFGGDGLSVQRLAQALARRGHDVTVVHDADAFAVLAEEPFSSDAAAPDPYGVHVVTLRSRLPMLNTLLTHQTGRPILNSRRLRALLDEGHFDVINFNNISLVGGPGLLAYGHGAVKVYFAHEHWLICPTHVLWRHNRELCDGRECVRCQLHYKRPPQLWRFTGLLDRHLADVDVFIAMSEFSRAKHREFGFPREMTVVPYFLPDVSAQSRAAQPRPNERPYFLFVGRLERIKGLDDVVAAFAAYRDADLLVVGDGAHASEMQRLAGGLPHVKFVGRLPVEALQPYYEHAIALLAPSLCFETFGVTVIEAFSHNTPVIARRLGPFPEILRSGGGMLFETRQDMVAAMRALQSAPERRRALGQEGYRAFCERWSESAVVPHYLDVVEAGRHPRPAEMLAASGVALQHAKP